MASSSHDTHQCAIRATSTRWGSLRGDGWGALQPAPMQRNHLPPPTRTLNGSPPCCSNLLPSSVLTTAFTCLYAYVSPSSDPLSLPRPSIPTRRSVIVPRQGHMALRTLHTANGSFHTTVFSTLPSLLSSLPPTPVQTAKPTPLAAVTFDTRRVGSKRVTAYRLQRLQHLGAQSFFALTRSWTDRVPRYEQQRCARPTLCSR